KKMYPEARVVAHPEVRKEIIEMADEVLSTSGMLRCASKSPDKQFIVATEQGLIERMKRENPGKEFFPAFRAKICANMKRTSPRDIYEALKQDRYEINVEQSIARRAVKALDEMLKYI
ncbi:MAG: quinolinate synthase NadA, partial [bacterium]|nr:quinolinate synthase NadA [bacterium]